MTDKSHMCVGVYDKDANEAKMLDCGYIDRPFHGTGDIFAAVMTGALVRGRSVIDAAQLAVDFVKAAIAETMKCPDIKIEYGVVFEKILAKFFSDFE